MAAQNHRHCPCQNGVTWQCGGQKRDAQYATQQNVQFQARRILIDQPQKETRQKQQCDAADPGDRHDGLGNNEYAQRIQHPDYGNHSRKHAHTARGIQVGFFFVFRKSGRVIRFVHIITVRSIAYLPILYPFWLEMSTVCGEFRRDTGSGKAFCLAKYTDPFCHCSAEKI